MNACADSISRLSMRRSRCPPLVKAHLGEFFGNTSVHGLKYLTEPRRPLHERVLWLVGFGLSLGTCLTLIIQTWGRWKESPVIVAMDETQRPIWDIPFPAVTICPESKIRSSLFNISNIIRTVFESFQENSTEYNITEKERELFTYLSVQCDEDYIPLGMGLNRTLDNTVIDYIENYSLPLKTTIMELKFGGYYQMIDAVLQPIMTDEGQCYSFNMLPAEHIFVNNTFHSSRDYLQTPNEVSWTINGGYHDNPDDDVYPYRALSSGQPIGLSLYLKTSAKDFEYLCSSLEEGYKIQLHSPAEFPRPQHQSFRVPLGSIVEVAVMPSEIITDAKLRGKYTVEERQCYFEDERRLRFFKQYTQQNCEVECLANITLKYCKCVLFYMPREMDTPICGSNKRHCARYAARELQRLEAGLLHKGMSQKHDQIPEEKDKCNCIQSCTHIRYLSEKSHSKLDVKKLMEIFPNFAALEEENLSQISIYFKESYFIPTRRMELYGIVDFLANCGGLLGLCLGMSVLSIVEVFYWLIVRPCCCRRRVIGVKNKNLMV